jgi:hypothetical protein
MRKWRRWDAADRRFAVSIAVAYLITLTALNLFFYETRPDDSYGHYETGASR